MLQTFGDDVEAGFDILRPIDGDHPLWLFEQQSAAGGPRGCRGQTVVEENEGSAGHVTKADRFHSKSSIAHMGAKHANIEEIGPYARISISPLPSTAMSPISRLAR